MSDEKKGLCTCSFAVAAGLWWALSLLLMALMAWLGDYGTDMVHLLGTLYAGYGPTLKGSLMGVIWGFIDGFVSGFIFAWLYNLCLHCRCKRCCHPKEDAGKEA